MNALRSASLFRSAFARTTMQQFRTKATMSSGSGQEIKKGIAAPQLRYQQKDAFKKNWLSDPSTYPIMVVLGCAMTFMVGMGANALLFYKDVKILPDKKGSSLQTWGHEKHVGVTESYANLVGRPKAEGLGIDHEQWQAKKDEYMKTSSTKE
uniref:Uncharacterized protein n=1 Tax=Craspedostauros australis TaxID=1486917 RepID=A0A6T6FZ76_9STRA|mmetsp:Transcript_21193/g.58974  ORF Transcript_21193/g.58974 Transcript_21193/m.58974 type:complete len:152 (+) Transcript_21193:477-932(+)